MMERVFRSALIALGLVLLLSGVSQAQPRMSKEDFKAIMGKPDVYLVDVRTAKDWEGSDQKIEGAVRENPADIDSWLSKYPRNATIVLYCA